MHWPIDAALLRGLIPAELEIDTFAGSAWIAIVPFTMWDIRALPLPAVPGFSAAHELNVRTYVHLQGVPGVWFFSLDCASQAAVLGARKLYHLAYFNADIELNENGRKVEYSLLRTDDPPAMFAAEWTSAAPLPQTEVGSLEFFLTERYCLYSEHRGKIY